jgi:acetyltransferase-like isoleucine patch superfamily enzyme
MNLNLLTKIKNVIFNRPAQFVSFLRQTYLFYQTRIISRIIFSNKHNLHLGKNVRLQALKSILVEPSANLSIGHNTIIYENAKLEAMGNGIITILDNSIIGDARITSRASITIGRNFLTSWNVFITDFDAHPVESQLRQAQMDSMVNNFFPRFDSSTHNLAKNDFYWDFTSSPISIGDNVWIGANVTILKGVVIGNNCIVATGAVVTRGEFPDNSIIAGNPAKVIKSLGEK